MNQKDWLINKSFILICLHGYGSISTMAYIVYADQFNILWPNFHFKITVTHKYAEYHLVLAQKPEDTRNGLRLPGFSSS